MRYLLLVFAAVALAGCQPERGNDVPAAPAPAPAPEPVAEAAPDMHTSRMALDWAGSYEGLLPCANCAGLHMRLELARDGSFELRSRRLVRDESPTTARGQFAWEPSGNVIVLDVADGPLRFAVGEGRLLLLEPGQVQPAWQNAEAVLPKLAEDGHGGRPDLAETLEDHRWALVRAEDADGQRLDALFPDAERGFEFAFAGSRLHVRGGCNGFRGEFELGAGTLEVRGGASTLMACDTPLMAADSQLASLLAEPLETVLVQGAQPTLVLLTRSGEVLVLSGELTLEARFGAPTRMFLEVAAATVPCDGFARGDGQCLQVRERFFDEQGLVVDPPGEWQVFDAHIKGYQHTPGIRNVLRVNRFAPADAGMSGGPVYVLDMVVQSEVVEP